MTTIAYKDGIIATDGQLTAGDVIVHSDTIKSMDIEGVSFFLCGSETHQLKLANAWPYYKIKGECRAAGFAVNQGVLFGLTEVDGRCDTFELPKQAAYAYGSGSEFAMGAMDAGATAEQAVSIAAGRDVGTGGTIRTYSAKTGGIIKPRFSVDGKAPEGMAS